MFIQVLPAGAGAKRTGASFTCSTVEEWIMGKAFNSILLAVDHCRGGAHAHQQAIVLAKRFRASLRMAYVVNSEDLAIPVPGPPGAPVVKPVVRGTRREAALTAEGREDLAAFVSALDIPLTVHIAPNSSRGGGYVKEGKAPLARHQVTAEFLHGGLLKAFAHEFSRPRSGLLECLPLLAFDGGFRRGLWFCRRRRLVERLLRTAAHGILLCPWLTGGETPSRLEEQKRWR